MDCRPGDYICKLMHVANACLTAVTMPLNAALLEHNPQISALSACSNGEENSYGLVYGQVVRESIVYM